MMKRAILILLVFFPAVLWAEPSTPTKKYPPYPDVWGYELPWAGKDDRVLRPDIFRMPDGDYFATYVKSRKKFERRDGTCCDFKHTFAGISFFSGSQRNLTVKELNAFGEKSRGNLVAVNSISFKDGSRIEQRITDCTPFRYSIVKINRAGQAVMNTTLVYVPETPRHLDYVLCEGMGSAQVEGRVEAPIATFAPLEDETFLLYESEGNHIIRFDQNLNSKFLSGTRLLLINTETVQQLTRNTEGYQARIDAVFQYVQGLKEGGGK